MRQWTDGGSHLNSTSNPGNDKCFLVSVRLKHRPSYYPQIIFEEVVWQSDCTSIRFFFFDDKPPEKKSHALLHRWVTFQPDEGWSAPEVVRLLMHECELLPSFFRGSSLRFSTAKQTCFPKSISNFLRHGNFQNGKQIKFVDSRQTTITNGNSPAKRNTILFNWQTAITIGNRGNGKTTPKNN